MAALDRRVPFIGFACAVAATVKVDVLTLMTVSEPLVSCARGEGGQLRIIHGRLLNF